MRAAGSLTARAIGISSQAREKVRADDLCLDRAHQFRPWLSPNQGLTGS